MIYEFFIGLVVAVILLATWTIIFFKYRYMYWKKKGVEVYGSPTIPFGCVQDVIGRKMILPVFLRKLYDYAKVNGLKYIGYYSFGNPIFVITDRDLIRHVLQIDSDVFLNRGLYVNEKHDPLSAHVFSLDGEKWKTMRQKITQTFTSGQLKTMFQTMAATSAKLEVAMKRFSGGEPLDARQLASRFTTDVIASSGFGIECNSLEDPDSEFLYFGTKVFNPTPSPLLVLKFMSFMLLPHNILKFVGVKIFEEGVRNFFMRIVQETVAYREQNDVYRKDFLHLLIQLKNRGKLVNDGKVNGEKEGSGTITMNELAAQVFVYYLAGFETSASATSYALYSLAANQDVQNRTREEIIKTLEKYDGMLCYDAVADMTYLQQVVDETLRLYPPGAFLERKCAHNYKVPGTDIVLDKNMAVQIPSWSLHLDSDYFENPHEFNPDRFSPENKRNMPKFVYLPFGEGPRNCVGLRLGILQTKVALISMIRKYRVKVNAKTKTPFEMDPTSLTLTPKGGIWLDVEEIVLY